MLLFLELGRFRLGEADFQEGRSIIRSGETFFCTDWGRSPNTLAVDDIL
ncbi:hypothetical protein HNQ41_003351 [Texcoconibacillus texcoconensis]|uniref:Uncharacterized protein n=1 Tax=Texcoconibacillus texcoconensis TaxID=1095777 RepID=A0A840QV23_9BACI|nr:hypothetical protein [Texcoconibacillus texcoconensis]